MGGKRKLDGGTNADGNEEDFPRGGGSVLSPLDLKQAREEAEAEVRGAERSAVKKRRNDGKADKGKGKKQRPNFDADEDSDKAGDEDGDFLGRDASSEKTPTYVSVLKYKALEVGFKLWGAVAEVNSNDMVISLPGGLRGFVKAKEASDLLGKIFEDAKQRRKSLKKGHKEQFADEEDKGQSEDGKDRDGAAVLADYFKIGQLVSCTVTALGQGKGLGGKGEGKRIELSLRAGLINQGLTIDSVYVDMLLVGCVWSIEDHGYLVSFGVPSLSGFLLTKDTPGKGLGEKLRKGQLVLAVVTSIDKKRRTVGLKADPRAVAAAPVKEHEGLTLGSLQPGWLVNARVQAVLSDGLLLSFLTYFTGMVDRFHLDTELPGTNLTDAYTEGQRVRARVLYVDPVAKRIALTLNRVLVAAEKPLSGTPVGTIFDNAVVRRVDPAIGMLMELPSEPTPCAGYAHISNVSDDHVDKLEKKFKVGQKVRARVIGHRLMDMVANISLKPSVVEQLFLSYADVSPGATVSGEIVVVDTFGAIVQLADNIRALCPLSHTAEHAVSKISSKIQVGARMKFRVLSCDSTAKKIILTRKKTMVSSKLMPITSYSDAVEGLVSHGYITGVKDFGCFVAFYGNVKGLAHRSELGIDADSKVEECFEEGQVVKCRVLRADPIGEKLSLSFITTSTRAINEGIAEVLRPGSIVAGKVVSVLEQGLSVEVQAGDTIVKAVLPYEQVADQAVLVEKFKEVLKVGVAFEQLLVLEHEEVREGKHNVLVSAKPSLLSAAEALPSDVSQLQPEAVFQAYIANVTEKGCFVRFLNRLTGLASPSQLADYFVSNPMDVFQSGQSVRAKILQVNENTQRFSVSLKPSVAIPTDASYLHHYFTVDEKIAEVRSKEEGGSLEWSHSYPVGGVVRGQVQDIKDYGVIVQLEGHDDVVGFVNFYQAGGEAKVGQNVTGVVLDVSRGDGIVDLSLRPELVAAHAHEPVPNPESSGKAKGKKSKVHLPKSSLESKIILHQLVEGIIELVKDEYLVVSLPIYEHAIAFASIHDFNMRVSEPRKRFKEGNRIVATVESLGEPSTGGRLLLLLSSANPAVPSSALGAGALSDGKKERGGTASTIGGKITAIHPLHADVQLDQGGRGRISVCEIQEDVGDGTNPLSKLTVGQVVDATLLGKAKGKGGNIQELSLRGPFAKRDKGAPGRHKLTWEKLEKGEEVVGYVEEVLSDWADICLTPWLSGRLFVLDSSNDPSQLQSFRSRFAIGQPIRCRVADFNKEKHALTLTLRGVEGGWNPRPQDGRSIAPTLGPFQVGDVVGGRIQRVLPTGGISVVMSGQLHGRVCATDLRDRWAAYSTQELVEGQFVRCVVLELPAGSTWAYQLSLRESVGGGIGGEPDRGDESAREIVPILESIADLQPGQEVQGYVKSCMQKGCFVALSRHIDARILPSELSDTFLENPNTMFPPGKLVKGRIMAVDPQLKRVEMTLRQAGTKGRRKELPSQSNASSLKNLSNLVEGEIVKGRVKRVENFGLFIQLDGMDGLTGMCHISEVSDKYIKDLNTVYQPGARVRAKVKKVDLENLRVSLVMKASAFTKDEKAEEPNAEDRSDKDEPLDGSDDEDVEELADGVDEEEEGPSKNESKLAEKVEKGQVAGKDKGKKRKGDTVVEGEKLRKKRAGQDDASSAMLDVAPLEVAFKEDEKAVVGEKGRDEEEEEDEEEDGVGEQEAKGKSKAKRDKKRAKEEREKAVAEAERRRLEGDEAPQSAEDYERLLLASPNSSFLWIKFMAFLLSLADPDAARAVAERALTTIHFREEAERLNVWVAYLNLEHAYGTPDPKEAVLKLFQRALSHADPKKLHFALLGIYERAEQFDLVDHLLRTMTRKFSTSAKVWLRNVQSLLKRDMGKSVQKTLDRSLLSLPARKHIKVISRTAIMEFKIGSPERGRTMMEGILRNYPKRTDLWSTYIDQEIRLGDSSTVRALFERAICLDLPPKRMKFIFKRYLDYEKGMNDDDRIESVKAKAMAYVEAKMG